MNHLQVSAEVVQVYPLRYTPAGIPALDLVLSHESQAVQMGQTRQVRLELRATAFGPQAESLAQAPLGQCHRFEGFLTQSRNGKGVVLQIQEFTPV